MNLAFALGAFIFALGVLTGAAISQAGRNSNTTNTKDQT